MRAAARGGDAAVDVGGEAGGREEGEERVERGKAGGDQVEARLDDDEGGEGRGYGWGDLGDGVARGDDERAMDAARALWWVGS